MAFTKATETFHGEVDSHGANTFVCEDANGSIRLKAWESELTRVDATKEAPEVEALRQISIKALRQNGQVIVIADFGTPNPTNRAVHFEISIPEFVETISIRAVNADVDVENTKAKVAIRLSNGRVDLQQKRGGADVELVNGSIRLSVEETARGPISQLRTTNGNIQIILSESADFNLDARTEMGAISSELSISADEQSPTVLKGKHGKGGQPFILRTTNGTIQVLKLHQ